MATSEYCSLDVLAERLAALGLNETKASEVVRNKRLAQLLRDVCAAAGVAGAELNAGVGKIGPLLYQLTTTVTGSGVAHATFIAREIAAGRLDTNDRVTAATRFCNELPAGTKEISEKDFNEACGIGITFTNEELRKLVDEFCITESARISAEGYKALFPVLAAARKHPRLRWASPQALKSEIEHYFLETLGPQTLEKNQPAQRAKAAGPAKDTAAKIASSGASCAQSSASAAADTQDNPSGAGMPNLDAIMRKMFLEGEMAKLHRPGENPQLSPEIMQEHLKATGGKVITRFPPEPNGYLHIGHAKAININFGYAELHKGVCYLRFDDTNPEAEEERYFVSILDSVRWLGFEPYKITYSSDYFDTLFNLAVELIRNGFAYVCHCTPEEINEQRGGSLDDKRKAALEAATAAAAADNSAGSLGDACEKAQPCKACRHRDRPIEENEKEFLRMRDGHYEEGEAVLRMKMDLTSGNPQFWDLSAYRVKRAPHCRTGTKWCIYPTYDYTHCICDSLENITHSFCTLEFCQSRPSYYWLVDALRIYKPVQWESARLNITNTVLSKRKLNRLVVDKHVNAWDDPRLYTLVGLRRRGVPPDAINMFARQLGITFTNAVTDVARFDNCVRTVLNATAPRLMAVLDPIPVTIVSFSKDYSEKICGVSVLPAAASVKAENSARDLELGQEIYIERSDFIARDAPADFRRLTPTSGGIGLMHTQYVIVYDSHDEDDNGQVTQLRVRAETRDAKSKERARSYVHWVSKSQAVSVEVRDYSPLFNHANPSAVKDGWLSDVNKASLEYRRSYVEASILTYLRDAKARAGPKYSSSRHNDPKVVPEATVDQMAAIDGLRFQFLRQGYYCIDPDTDLSSENEKDWSVVFNRTISLREDSSRKAAESRS